MKLAAYLAELAPLIMQLEATVGEVSAGRFFEWRIRARLIEDKLHQAAKPPGALQQEDAEVEKLLAAPKFSEQEIGQAREALRHAGALREALQNKRVKIALEAARALAVAIV